MSDPTRGQPPLSNDQLVVVLLVGGLVVFAIRGHRALLHQLHAWLQDHQVVLPGTAGLQIPHIGGLDGPRLLIAGGVLLLTALTVKIALRARRSRT